MNKRRENHHMVDSSTPHVGWGGFARWGNPREYSTGVIHTMVIYSNTVSNSDVVTSIYFPLK